VKAFDAKRFDPIRGTTFVGAGTFGLNRPARAYADTILQNGSALEPYPVNAYPSGILDRIKSFADTVDKNMTDFADEFLGRGDRSDESTAGSVRGAFLHGVVFDFIGGMVESVADIFKNPKAAIEGLKMLATEPDVVLPAIGAEIKTWMNDKIANGSPEDRAAAAGQILGEVAACFIGVGEINAAVTGVKTIRTASTAAKVADKTSDAMETTTDISKVTTATKTADDVAQTVKNVEKTTQVFDNAAEKVPDTKTVIENFRKNLDNATGGNELAPAPGTGNGNVNIYGPRLLESVEKVLAEGAAGNFGSIAKLESHFIKHNEEFNGAYSNAKEYLQGARDVMQNGYKIQYQYNDEIRMGYVRFMGTSGKGISKFEFVGTNTVGEITTYHVESGKDFWKMINGTNIPVINPID
jgi:hypothetical protein